MKTKALALLVLAILLTLPLTGCNRRAVEEVPLSEQMAQEAQSNTEAQAGTTSPVVTAEPTVEVASPTVEATAVMTVETTPEPTVTPTAEPSVEPTATAVATTTAETGSNGETIHIVQAGENLFRIALRYGTTVEAIAQANGITNPALIRVGQKLVIPASTSTEGGTSGGTAGETIYTVQPGDNLFRIALKYNMSYLYLAQYNGIANPNFLIAGQQIRIPAQP